MKKLFSVALFLLIVGTAFAEDATTLPAGVGRVYLVPVYAWAGAYYDYEGGLTAGVLPGDPNPRPGNFGDVRVFSLGAALEYGVTGWFSAAIQWTPAWTIYSNIDGLRGYMSSHPWDGFVDMNGPWDLFVGGKIRMNAPLPENKAGHFAVSVAPGVKIPLPGFSDWKGEKAKVDKNGDIHYADPDKHTWGFGARAYINYYVTNDFYVNLYNETIIYPFRAKPNQYGAGINNLEIKYGPDITFELEPHIDRQITEGIRFGMGVPIEFKYTGSVDFYRDDTFFMRDINGSPKGLVSLKPKMSVFFTSLPLPLEIQGEYDAPIYGRGALAVHKVVFQLKTYWKIP